MMPERNTKDETSANTKWTKIDQNEKNGQNKTMKTTNQTQLNDQNIYKYEGEALACGISIINTNEIQMTITFTKRRRCTGMLWDE